MIRRVDLVPQYELYEDEIQSAIQSVLKSGRYTLGQNVESFENEFSKYIGSNYGIGVNSGTDALILSLTAIGIRPGDEVITTPFTAIPTYSAIRQVNAIPIFADVEPDTFLIDINKIAELITKKTKAIIPVHLFGNIVDIKKLRDLIGPDITIIEDCAQAHGGEIRKLKAGSMGDLSAFSFYPTKNLGGYGDGGMILTDNDQYYQFIKKKRQYGMINKDEFEFDGLNSRLDEIQAAILRIKLKDLDLMNEKRMKIAKMYDELLNSNFVKSQKINSEVLSSYHVFSIVCKTNRDELALSLKRKGIQTNIYYTMPLYNQKGYKNSFTKTNTYKNAEYLSKSILALPIYPEMNKGIINRVSEYINRYYEP